MSHRRWGKIGIKEGNKGESDEGKKKEEGSEKEGWKRRDRRKREVGAGKERE